MNFSVFDFGKTMGEERIGDHFQVGILVIIKHFFSCFFLFIYFVNFSSFARYVLAESAKW